MKKILFTSLLLAGVNTSTAANSTNNDLELPEMVVTATRNEQPTKNLSTATTVYTRKEIEQLQVKTLPELLQGSTGIDITQSGGYGKIASVFMRGTNPDSTLVLIDGIKVGSLTTGTTPFEFIPMDQVERVEIVRGPLSSLYGSEAIGGVIQIFTRKGSNPDKPKVTLDTGGGSYNTYRVAGSVSGAWKNNWYSLSSSQFSSQGFNAQQATPGLFGVNQPDHDGYLNTAVNARVGHHFDKGDVEASFIRSQGKTEYDGNLQNKTDFVNQVAALTGNVDLTELWHSSLKLGQSMDNNDNFAPNGLLSSRFDSTRWNVSWLNTLTLSDNNTLTLGSDYRLDEVSSSAAYKIKSRYDVGVFGQLQSRLFDNHYINASLRWDENEQFGAYVTGSFGWRYNWNHGISLLANFGNAFNAPSFNSLYYPNYGNPNLKPEQSTSFEAGIEGVHDWGKWSLRGYHTNIDNLITPVCSPLNFQCQAENVNKAQIDGLESEIGTQILGWNAKLRMDLLNPQNRITNLRLARRADETLAFDLSRSFGPVDVGGNVLAQDYRYNDPANTVKVAGYVTVDLRSAYHINKNWLIDAKLSNLLDKHYQTVDTYNSAGRNFFVSIHFNN